MTAKLAQATKCYADLERKWGRAEERREKAEKELALEREVSFRHLSDLAKVNDQMIRLNSELEACRTDLLSAQEGLRKAREEQAESLLNHQRLLNSKEKLLLEK